MIYSCNFVGDGGKSNKCCGEGCQWAVKSLSCANELTERDLFQIEGRRVCRECYSAYCAVTYTPDTSSEEGMARALRCGAGRATGTCIITAGHGCGVSLSERLDQKVAVIGNVPYCIDCHWDLYMEAWASNADRLLDEMARRRQRLEEALGEARTTEQREAALAFDYLRVQGTNAQQQPLHCNKKEHCTNSYKHRGRCQAQPPPMRTGQLLASRSATSHRGGYLELQPTAVHPSEVLPPPSKPTTGSDARPLTRSQDDARRRKFEEAQACLLARLRARGLLGSNPFGDRDLFLTELMHAEYPGDQQVLLGIPPLPLSEADNTYIRHGGPGDAASRRRWLARTAATREQGGPEEPTAWNDGRSTTQAQSDRQEH